jgi:deazaflavin-dependent oxidoreductase (nitroreductase family)
MNTDPDETVHDSPKGWVADHIHDYVSSDGEQGHRWRGVETLLLTTRGRKSGKLRRTALIYGEVDGGYVVVASYGGSPRHPEWYLNLMAHPEVRVQVGPDVVDGAARTTTGEERSRLWTLMCGIWPDYDNYQKRTSREIPVVLIEVSR